MAGSRADELDAMIDGIISIMQVQQAAWIAAGQPPTYSINGQSVQWSAWWQDRLKDIQALQETKRVVASPYRIVGYGRAARGV
jgi:hypothetical protein